MRQLLGVLLLLSGVSCSSFDRQPAPFLGAGPQQIIARPVVPMPVTWKNPSGQTVNGSLPPALADKEPGKPPDPSARAESQPTPEPAHQAAYASLPKAGPGLATEAVHPGPDLPAPPPSRPPAANSLARTAFVEGKSEPPATDTRTPVPQQLPPMVTRAMPNPAATPPAPAPTLPAEPEPVGPATPLPGGTPVLRVVNSKRITLDFELKEAGPGVTGVDLWVTRDMKTWKKYEGVRPTTRAYVIEVKDEGLYGLTLIARSNTGPALVPQPGDLPQVWVTVDTTPPVVQLAGVDLSLTSKEPTLIVRWKAQDRNFNKRPITITCAEQPEGPWVTLAGGLENTGRSEVPLTATLPKRVFLRVEAQDLAGNVGRAQTSGPLRLEFPWSPGSPAPTPPGAEPSHLLPPPPGPEPARPQVSIIEVDGVEK